MSLYLKIGQRKNDINFFFNFPPHISVKVFDRTGQSSWAMQKIIWLKKNKKICRGGIQERNNFCLPDRVWKKFSGITVPIRGWRKEALFKFIALENLWGRLKVHRLVGMEPGGVGGHIGKCLKQQKKLVSYGLI